MDVVVGTAPITGDSLKGRRLLYLRAPSQEFTADERAAIVAFVRRGGSLLLVSTKSGARYSARRR